MYHWYENEKKPEHDEVIDKSKRMMEELRKLMSHCRSGRPKNSKLSQRCNQILCLSKKGFLFHKQKCIVVKDINYSRHAEANLHFQAYSVKNRLSYVLLSQVIAQLVSVCDSYLL